MICPNPECPDRPPGRAPAEYREGITACPVCGAALVEAESSPPAPAARGQAASAGSWQGVPVLVTTDLAAADLAAAVLETEGIPYFRRARVLGGVTLGLGNAAPIPGQQHAISVPDAAAEDARDLLAGLGLTGVGREDADGAPPEPGPSAQDDRPIGPGSPPAGPGMLRRVVVVVFLLVAAVVAARLLAELLASG